MSKVDQDLMALLTLQKVQLESLQDDLDDLGLHHETALTLPWYVKLCLKNWPVTSQLVLGSILVQVFSLALPIFNMIIFDRVFGRNNLAALDIIGLGIVLVVVFDLLVKMFRSYLLSHQSCWLDEIVGKEWLNHLLRQLSVSSKRNGDKEEANPLLLVERFGDILKINKIVVQGLFVASLDAIFSTILITVLLLINPILTLVSVSPLIPLTLLAFWQTPRSKAKHQQFAKELRQRQMGLAELLKNYETLLSCNAHYQKIQFHFEQLQSFVRKHFGHTLDQMSQGNIQGFFINLGSVITLYVGAKLVLSGDLSFGSYLAVNMLSRNVLTSYQKMVSSWLEYQEAATSTEALREMMEDSTTEARHVRNRPYANLANEPATLSVEKVYFRWQDNEPWVVQDVSFSIQPTERIVITGKSGSGKSVLAKMLHRLKEPEKGIIRLGAVPIDDADPDHWRLLVGYCPSQPAMFEGTLYDNITLGLSDVSMNSVLDVLKLTQLQELIDQSDKGLDTPVNVMGMNLSMSQVQRIGLARMLLRNPKVMIFDDALRDLAPMMRISIIREIHERYKDSAVIHINNFVPLHQLCSRILVMETGSIVEEGAFKELLEKQSAYVSLLQIGAPTL